MVGSSKSFFARTNWFSTYCTVVWFYKFILGGGSCWFFCRVYSAGLWTKVCSCKKTIECKCFNFPPLIDPQIRCYQCRDRTCFFRTAGDKVRYSQIPLWKLKKLWKMFKNLKNIPAKKSCVTGAPRRYPRAWSSSEASRQITIDSQKSNKNCKKNYKRRRWRPPRDPRLRRLPAGDGEGGGGGRVHAGLLPRPVHAEGEGDSYFYLRR